MEIKRKDVIQIIISLGLGLFVFYLVYKQLDFDEMAIIAKEAKWSFIITPILLCLFSSWLRALRWNMLIEPLGNKPMRKNSFVAVLFGYFVNHIFPRAGEVARCGVLSKYENQKFSSLVGTVITERIFDLIVTAVIVCTTIIIEWDVFSHVLSNTNLGERLFSIATNPALIAVAFAAVLICFLIRKKIKNNSLYKRVRGFIVGLIKGLKSFVNVKNKPLFLFYSFFIFFVYFLMLYTSFWLFDFTAGLSYGAGLVTYVFGALGMIAPVQGGIGTYEFMTIQALGLYGISASHAGIFALLSHLVEIIVNTVAGGLGFLLLPWMNRKTNRQDTSEPKPSI